MEPTAPQPTAPSLDPVIIPPSTENIPTTSSSGKKIVLFICCFVGLSLLATAAVFAYVPPAFLPSSVRMPLLAFGYKIPLLPKTAEQVLVASANASKNLKAYNANLSLSAKLGAGAISAGSVDLTIDGPVDFRDTQNAKFDLAVATNINVAGTNYNGKGRLRGLDKTIYLKIDELSDSIIDLVSSYTSVLSTAPQDTTETKANLTAFFANWLSYNTAGLATPASEALARNTQNQSIIDTTRRKTQDVLTQKTFLPSIKQLGLETIDGVRAYHLQFSPTQEDIKTILREYNATAVGERKALIDKNIDTMATSITSFTLDSWFKASDAMPVKMSIQTTINLQSIMGSLASTGYSPQAIAGDLTQQNLAISTVLLISDLDSTEITAPSPILEPKDYLTGIMDAAKTESARAAEKAKIQQTTDLQDISKGLLNYNLKNGAYPKALSEIFGSTYSQYTYRLVASGKKFVVYITEENGDNFGISTSSSYPHVITAYDLQ